MEFSIQQSGYLQKFINSIAGFSLPIDVLSSDIRQNIFDFLIRTEEFNNNHRDQWDNWEGSFTIANMDCSLAYPWIDEIIYNAALVYQKTNPEIVINPKYPNNKGFALCITHDVDNINYSPSLSVLFSALKRFVTCRSLSPTAIQLMLGKPLKDIITHRTGFLQTMDFYKFIEIEQKLGFNSTFYCFSEQLLKPHYFDSYYKFVDKVIYNRKAVVFRDVLKEIESSGWDIGLHGSYNSALDISCLRYEKQMLEQTLGFEIKSTRQHWMHYEISKTPLLHEELGFCSDSTFGFNRSIGFRSGTSHPHRIWNSASNKELQFWEIPLNIMDGTLFYSNAMELNEALAIKHCLRLMDRVEKVGGVLTINWHPDHLNKPRFFSVYQEILQEARHRNAWGCSANQLALQWSDYFDKVNGNG